MGTSLVTCRSCGAPNHPDRSACGRCRADLPRRATASATVETSPEAERDDTGPLPDPAGPSATGAGPVGRAASPAVDGDRDATGAMVATPSPASAVDVTSVVQSADVRARRVGARVLDVLRGPTPSDTQPLDASAVPAPRPADDRGGPMPRRSVVVVSVLGLVAGAVVGIAAARGALFSGDADDDAPSFDAGVYRRLPGTLQVEAVRATSSLPSTGSNVYEPELVLDGNLTTAWNSDGAGRPDGVGERLVLDLAEPAWVTAIEFANGYQKDDVRFLANARLSRATLEFDGGERVNVVLLDQSGWQRVPLPQPVLATTFSLEVVEVHPGDTYRDLALSGIRVLGHLAVGADRDAALLRPS